MGHISYLCYYVGKVPDGKQGIAVSLERAVDILSKLEKNLSKYRFGSSYSDDVNWAIFKEAPSKESNKPFIRIVNEGDLSFLSKAFKESKIEMGEFTHIY